MAGVLSGRALAGAERRFRPAWRASLSGRVLAGVTAGARRLAAGSLLLSLDGGRSRPLKPGSSSLTARLLIWVYATAIHLFGESWPGRTARRCARGVGSSAVAGVGRVARLGRGRAGHGHRPRRARVAVDGPAAGRWRPRSCRRWPWRLPAVWRSVAIPGDRGWTSPSFGMVAAAALGVGVLAGASAGVTPIAAVVVALVCAAVVVLPYRAELLLLAAGGLPLG